MKGAKEGWKAVGEQVTARFATLSISKQTFTDRTRVSPHTLNAALRGQPIQRLDKRGDIAAGLGWTRDSIDLILQGEEPVLATSSAAEDEGDRLGVIDSRLARIEQMIGRLLDDSRAGH